MAFLASMEIPLVEFSAFRTIARPRDTRPLSARTLQICSFELGPKTLEIRGFRPKALQRSGFYADFDQKHCKCADFARILRGFCADFLGYNPPHDARFFQEPKTV